MNCKRKTPTRELERKENEKNREKQDTRHQCGRILS